MNAIETKLQNISATQMMEMARTLSGDFSDAASMVLDAIMLRLERIMPEARFVAFCEEL